MKKTMRKILALVLVLMMTIPVMAIQASADTLPANYADVADGALIYKVDFNGTEGFWTPGAAWAGMSADPSEDGTSVRLIPEGNNGTANVWGAELPAEDNKNADGKFRMLQSSYTVVFTLNAEDEDQEMGLLLDWKTGFAITPGKDSFRYIKDYQAETVFTGTYEGTKSLTQTYAIEIKDEGTAGNINDHSTFQYNCTVYNLYVVKDGAWVKIFSLDTSSNATALKNALNWGSGDWEFVLRLFRDGLNATQYGYMECYDMSVYKGLAITSHNLAAPALPDIEAPEDLEDKEDNGGDVTPNQNAGSNSTNKETETKETEADTTAAPETTEAAEEKGGCGASVTVCGAALLTASAVGMLGLTVKKKKDE
ncbi:MAG: hypothetical protein IJZ83_03975 [Clostridia bacterium]|nr:hypothetical protein [Clostridia bacterium]